MMGGEEGTPGGRGAGPPGCKVLVVEDGFVVALGIAEVLRELGCAALGPAPSAVTMGGTACGRSAKRSATSPAVPW